MKKLLNLLGIIGLTATGANSVVACCGGKAKIDGNLTTGENITPVGKTKPEITPVGKTKPTPVGKTKPTPVGKTKPTPVVLPRLMENFQNNKISLSSMKDLTDRIVHGNPFLVFKLPINLYNDLEVDDLSKKTKEERKIIFDNVDSFIKKFVKEKIHEKVLEINNSLTENDYDITFLDPNNTRIFNVRYKSIEMSFIIKGKNKATGEIQKELVVDVSVYGNQYD